MLKFSDAFTARFSTKLLKKVHSTRSPWFFIRPKLDIGPISRPYVLSTIQRGSPFSKRHKKKQIEKLWLFLFLFLKALRISFFKAILRSKERSPHHLSFLSKSLLYHNRHYSGKSAATKTTLSFHVSSNSSLRTHFSLPSLFLRYLIRLTPYHIFL